MFHPKTQLRLAMFFAVALNIVNLAFWTLLIYPFQVVRVDSVRVLSPVVKAGDQARFEVKACKYYPVAGEAQRKLINHYEYFLAEELTNDKGVGCFTKTFSIPIPSYVDAGTYHISNDLTHTIYGIRKIHYHYETPDFQIVK